MAIFFYFDFHPFPATARCCAVPLGSQVLTNSKVISMLFIMKKNPSSNLYMLQQPRPKKINAFSRLSEDGQSLEN